MAQFLVLCILIPFLGTALGGCTAFGLRGDLSPSLRQSLSGLAAGVMTAASVWSLLIPAMEQSARLGGWAFLPAAAGFWLGMVLFLLLDRLIPRLETFAGSSPMLLLAVTLHNLPEGMAVGAACAGWLADGETMPASGLMILSVGIAVQNFPEGAIISLPLRAEGCSRSKAALLGALSGA
ncbi:MAG: ZIP family metal transporter, partial [Oscillospiraceae bacterium]|nr:ZIP family metal transporter [Oscillospiraceae bacterium]